MSNNQYIVVYVVVLLLTIHAASLLISRLKSTALARSLPDSTLLLYTLGLLLAWASDEIDAPREDAFTDDDLSIGSLGHYREHSVAAFTLFRALRSVREKHDMASFIHFIHSRSFDQPLIALN